MSVDKKGSAGKKPSKSKQIGPIAQLVELRTFNRDRTVANCSETQDAAGVAKVGCDGSQQDEAGACGLLAGSRGDLVIALCDGVKAAMLAGGVGLARVAWEALGKLLDGDAAGMVDLRVERASKRK